MPDGLDIEPLMRSIRSVVGDRAWSTQSARLSAMVAEHAGTADAAAAFDVYYAHWRNMPATGPRRPVYAGYLLQLVPLMRQSGTCCTSEQAEELAAAALAAGDPAWQALITGVRALVLLQDHDTVWRDPALLERVVEDLDSASGLLPQGAEGAEGAATATGFRIGRAVARAEHARLRGGEAELDTAIGELAACRRAFADRPDDQAYLTCFIACLRAGRAHLGRDEDAMAGYIREHEIALARLPRHHPGRDSAEQWLAADRLKLRGLVSERTGELWPSQGPEPGPAPGTESGTGHGTGRGPGPGTGPGVRAPLDHTDRYALIQAAVGLIGRAANQRREEARAAVAEAIGLLEEALARCGEGDEHWLRCAAQLATAHCTLSGLVRWEPKPFSNLSRAGREINAHLDEAISLLRRARRLAEGPAHPVWVTIGHVLADALRSRSMMLPQFKAAAAARMGKESREIALSALSGLAWSVLLQSGTRHAMEAGDRAMEEHCLDIALWCVEDGELHDAVRALDSGRALLLHAAQVGADVPGMLSELGQDQLAEEWRAAGPVPLDPGPGAPGIAAAQPAAAGPEVRLRRRVLEVLAASPYRDRLLSPPSSAEIARALRALGADALVYLVPRSEISLPLGGRPTPGAALIVGADGTLRSVGLPDLALDAPELAAYRTAGGAVRDPHRDAGPVTAPRQSPRPNGAEALDRLCGWAWRSVLAPVVRVFPGHGGSPAARPDASRVPGYGDSPAARPDGSRVPRVVLVPLGTLAAVPWHAAWRAEGSGRRYALEDLQISYAPSARTLCEVAGRAPADLRAPGTPALVIGNPTRDLRYAGEEAEAIHRVFYPEGVYLDADTADATEVSARLADLRGGVLHLACHARVDPGERHSARLELAGGSRLAAEELTEGTNRRWEPGLVCIAACWSNVSSRGYDEAYSLATAFLTAGARTVLGSLWPVPDEATSLLMYMTHHYVRREALPPGQALRRAQLWMLDPWRKAPPEMPARLAVRARHIRPDDLVGWAGFTHQGW
ncbi:CHAT domain-containing protein [Streptomyces sp. DW26H14]|uniref:CHAT domain-containing protein n=1 Tax=Streptomyces sp. DW26H14 TaxID=3435395 RepID=UPI00403DC7AE